MKLSTSVLSAALLPTLLLGACSGTPASQTSSAAPATAGFPLTIDNCGHQLTFQAPPKRTVSLNQSSTEIQLSLGVAQTMVGTGTWTDPVLPALEADNEKVERLADNAPSLEAVVAKEPDFVTASFPSTLSDKTVASFEKFESLGVPAYLAPNQCGKKSGDDAPEENFTIDKVYQEIDDLAKIHGVPDKGAELTTELRTRLEKAVAQKPGKPVTVMFWFANSEAPYVAGGSGASQFVSDQLGVTNVYSDQRDEWPQVSWEDVAAKNPDIIVMGDLTRKSQTAETAQAKIEYLKSNPVTAEMEAVKNNRFVKVAGGDMNPSIRTVDLAEKLVAGIEEFGLR
ncbi:MAG: ABC transporter substrate-binding protein [Arachnia propionica]|uniref:ABC transporter substrate-binding protein n=1 Tax=Arachnia propionica TaxID=1750 RepID=UPI0027024162|nr:ABC transporter substrate-binding protein [Arachnia propionica]